MMNYLLSMSNLRNSLTTCGHKTLATRLFMSVRKVRFRSRRPSSYRPLRCTADAASNYLPDLERLWGDPFSWIVTRVGRPTRPPRQDRHISSIGVLSYVRRGRWRQLCLNKYYIPAKQNINQSTKYVILKNLSPHIILPERHFHWSSMIFTNSRRLFFVFCHFSQCWWKELSIRKKKTRWFTIDMRKSWE